MIEDSRSASFIWILIGHNWLAAIVIFEDFLSLDLLIVLYNLII